MDRLVIGALLSALVLAGCGGGASVKSQTSGGDPSTLSISPPSNLDAGGRADFLAGRTVAAEAGCLACHVLGTQGNPGPGHDLTHVGSRLTEAQLLRTLRSPQAPMPSYAELAPPLLASLVKFLHDLR
jgi:menaquinol-cytochrome c reductase cytochrome b/c subunit